MSASLLPPSCWYSNNESGCRIRLHVGLHVGPRARRVNALPRHASHGAAVFIFVIERLARRRTPRTALPLLLLWLMMCTGVGVWACAGGVGAGSGCEEEQERTATRQDAGAAHRRQPPALLLAHADDILSSLHMPDDILSLFNLDLNQALRA